MNLYRLSIALIIFIICLLSLSSCNFTIQCPDGETPPQPYVFEIVDSISNENYITKNSIQDIYIRIRNNGASTAPLDHTIWNDCIHLAEMKETGVIDCIINVADSFEFKFYIKENKVYIDDCTSYMEPIEMKIEDVSYVEVYSDYFKIYVN